MLFFLFFGKGISQSEEPFKLDTKAWFIGVTPSAFFNSTPMLQFSAEKGLTEWLGVSTDIGGIYTDVMRGFRFRPAIHFYPVSLDNFILSMGLGYNFRRRFTTEEEEVVRGNGQFTEIVDVNYANSLAGPVGILRFSFPSFDSFKTSIGIGVGVGNYISSYPTDNFIEFFSSKTYNGSGPIFFFNLNLAYQFLPIDHVKVDNGRNRKR